MELGKWRAEGGKWGEEHEKVKSPAGQGSGVELSLGLSKSETSRGLGRIQSGRSRGVVLKSMNSGMWKIQRCGVQAFQGRQGTCGVNISYTH